MPKLPSFDGEGKSISLEKVCPFCGADNSPTAIVCGDNKMNNGGKLQGCGTDISRVKAEAKPRTPDVKGKKNPRGFNNKTYIPGFNTQLASTNIHNNPNYKDTYDMNHDDIDPVDIGDIYSSAEDLCMDDSE